LGSATNGYSGATNIGDTVANTGTGALRVTETFAIQTSSGVNVAGGNATAKLELDNATTGLTVYPIVTLNGRQPTNITPHVLNVAGNNTLYGDVSLQVGGDRYVLQSDAGELAVNTITNNTGNATDRFVYLQGAGNGKVQYAIANGTGTGLLHVTKAGAGTWTLSGSNSYTGDTTVNGGTLVVDATGSISSSTKAIVKSGAVLDVSAYSSAWSAQTLGGLGNVKR